MLAPDGLDLTTSTAEIFRLPEVQDAIVGDYIVLPCDLVCELSGRALWETWATLQSPSAQGNLKSEFQKGGFGVWYDTRDVTETGVAVKKEETDLLATVEVGHGLREDLALKQESLRSQVREAVLALPTDTLRDQLKEKEHLRIRTQLLQKKGNVKINVKARDAHIYFMPHWTREYLRSNETFDSFGEDAVGWWAKARWQEGLQKKLGLDQALRPKKRRRSAASPFSGSGELDLDLVNLSSTAVSDLRVEGYGIESTSALASRVPEGERISARASQNDPTSLPPFLAYVHPSLYVPNEGSTSQQQSGQKQKQQPKSAQQQPQQPPSALLRRVDTVKLLLSVSLYLARLPSILAAISGAVSMNAHPFCHPQQVHTTSALPAQATISTQNVLIDANCALQPKITVRDCVIGANCHIASGSRLHGCLLMEGVIIEERVVMSGCVAGRRCRVGNGSELKDCFVQEGYVVADETSAKGEVLAGFDEEVDLDDGEIDDEEGGLELGAP